jgi:hypothetical protein
LLKAKAALAVSLIAQLYVWKYEGLMNNGSVHVKDVRIDVL